MECTEFLVRCSSEILFVACQRLIQPRESEDLLHARAEIDELQLAPGPYSRHSTDEAQGSSLGWRNIASERNSMIFPLRTAHS